MDKMVNKPLVAIYCLVYNHEPYLRDCFEGFVMQQTNFPFVAIVHDDASTDSSAAIIREYEEKYPDKIKPIYEKENLYQKGGFLAINEVMFHVIDTMGVEYVAMCEGDDYWTDPLKLQKQVDFMEANSECAICFHKIEARESQTGKLICFDREETIGQSTIDELASGNYITTLSVLFRNYPSAIAKYLSLGYCYPGDYALWMILAEKGYIYKLDECMAVYRYGCGIWSSADDYANNLRYIGTLHKLYCVLDSSKVKNSLLKQIDTFNDAMLSDYYYHREQLKKIQTSYAYRIGKLILKPLTWFKYR